MPGRIWFPEYVLNSGLLHWLHNNYSYLKICLQVAQLTNCYRKLNTNNLIRYCMREVKQIIQISNKTKIRTFWDWFTIEKIRELSLESIFLALIKKKRVQHIVLSVLFVHVYHFINIFSEMISEDVLFACSCIIQWVIVTLYYLKLNFWIWLHT